MPLEMVGVHTEYRMPLPDEPGQNGEFTAVYPLIVRETDIRREILTIDGRLVASKERTGQCSPGIPTDPKRQMRSAAEAETAAVRLPRKYFDALVSGMLSQHGAKSLYWRNKNRNELFCGSTVVMPDEREECSQDANS